MIFRKDIKTEIAKNTRLVKQIRSEYSSKELATMIDTKKTAYDLALDNVKWCFDNFETICVSTSGGKDSSVLFDMCLREARSRGREIHLFYADEEFELSSSVEIVKWQMEQEGVIPHWYCPQIKMDNAYNKEKPFITIWEQGREWYHTPPSYAIFDNLGQDTFGNFLDEFNRLMTKQYDSCINLIGMTAYEGLKRLKALKMTSYYFGKAWISNLNKGYISGSPLEAMQVRDIWTYIALNDVRVNDYYAKSIPYVKDFRNVRVSSLLHEQTITGKEFLQNIYPDDYERMERIVGGINSTFALLKIRNRKPSAIPTYYEYMLFLLETIEKKRKAIWIKHFIANLRRIARETIEVKVEISAYSICRRIFTGDIKGESYANNLINARDSYKRMRGIK